MHTARVSGLWQYLQLILQPCRKIAVRLPGPSTLLKGMILLISAVCAIFCLTRTQRIFRSRM